MLAKLANTLAKTISHIARPAPGLALFLLLLGWYVLTMSGHTYTPDEETMFAVTQNLIASRSFEVQPDFLMNYSAQSANALKYSRHGPGQSIAALPFLLAGQAVAGAAPDFAHALITRLFVLLLPPLVTAATAWLLFAWVRELGYSVRIALLVGLLYGLTTLAWPYSRTFFAEPLATGLLVLCAYGIRREQVGWWMAAGAAAGCAVTVKAQVLLALPLLAGYALLVSWRGSPVATLRAVGARAVAGLASAQLPLVLLMMYQARHFGDPLVTGYGGFNPSVEFVTPWQEGLYGLTISPGKGLLLYAPTVLLGLVGLGFRLRQQWRESLLAVGILAVHLAFYSRILYWHGDGSWGPRYMVFVLPFVLLPAAGLLAYLAAWRNRAANALVAGLVVVAFLIQWLPILVNLNTYLQLREPQERYYTVSGSPLVGHARLWSERVSEWLLRVVPPQDAVVMREGFSYSEGDRTAGEMLPRWTYADARFAIYPPAEGPIEGRLVVGDHRPWPLERAQFHLLLNGEPLQGVQRTDLTGENIIWELRFQLAPEQAQAGAVLTLHSDTWNPEKQIEGNPRNEDLGLLLSEIELTQAGQALELREALPIPPLVADRRGFWLWHYDTPNHHLFDHWLWYLLVARLPVGTLLLLLALIGLPALVAFGVGLRGVLPLLRPATQAAPAVAQQAAPQRASEQVSG